MPECRCLTGAVDYREKCRCRIFPGMPEPARYRNKGSQSGTRMLWYRTECRMQECRCRRHRKYAELFSVEEIKIFYNDDNCLPFKTCSKRFSLCFRFSKVASRSRAGRINCQTCRVSTLYNKCSYTVRERLSAKRSR
jgi:hypothetical protein